MLELLGALRYLCRSMLMYASGVRTGRKLQKRLTEKSIDPLSRDRRLARVLVKCGMIPATLNVTRAILTSIPCSSLAAPLRRCCARHGGGGWSTSCRCVQLHAKLYVNESTKNL